jgi:hypothetical protein
MIKRTALFIDGSLKGQTIDVGYAHCWYASNTLSNEYLLDPITSGTPDLGKEVYFFHRYAIFNRIIHIGSVNENADYIQPGRLFEAIISDAAKLASERSNDYEDNKQSNQ